MGSSKPPYVALHWVARAARYLSCIITFKLVSVARVGQGDNAWPMTRVISCDNILQSLGVAASWILVDACWCSALFFTNYEMTYGGESRGYFLGGIVFYSLLPPKTGWQKNNSFFLFILLPRRSRTSPLSVGLESDSTTSQQVWVTLQPYWGRLKVFSLPVPALPDGSLTITPWELSRTPGLLLTAQLIGFWHINHCAN